MRCRLGDGVVVAGGRSMYCSTASCPNLGCVKHMCAIVLGDRYGYNGLVEHGPDRIDVSFVIAAPGQDPDHPDALCPRGPVSCS